MPIFPMCLQSMPCLFAFQVSQWMTDKMYIPVASGDVAARLNLIYNVHGLEKVENYFDNITKQLKGYDAYTAMLNCYAHEKSVEKAEMLMQKMRDMGFDQKPICFNIMMNLYYQIGNHEKIDALMLDMEEKGMRWDQFTFGIRLSAYAAASDVEGIDKIINMMKSNPQMVLDFDVCAVTAHGYLKMGLVDKAMPLLKKMEGVVTAKMRNTAFDLLLKLYADAGKKGHLYQSWNLYKKNRNIFNKGYMSMMGSLLKLDDIEGAEKIFEEWKSRELSYDSRIPCLLIDAYCRKGLLEKAESLVDHAEINSGVASVDTWYCLARGYLEGNQIHKAADAMKKAISLCPPEWKPGKEILATCVEYLEGMGDTEGADRFLKLLRDKSIFSEAAYNRLMNYIKGKE